PPVREAPKRPRGPSGVRPRSVRGPSGVRPRSVRSDGGDGRAAIRRHGGPATGHPRRAPRILRTRSTRRRARGSVDGGEVVAAWEGGAQPVGEGGPRPVVGD